MGSWVHFMPDPCDHKQIQNNPKSQSKSDELFKKKIEMHL